jgi:hypothetical protein
MSNWHCLQLISKIGVLLLEICGASIYVLDYVNARKASIKPLHKDNMTHWHSQYFL